MMVRHFNNMHQTKQELECGFKVDSCRDTDRDSGKEREISNAVTEICDQINYGCKKVI